nr:ABC transporter permease [Acidobacteriota bacterium]
RSRKLLKRLVATPMVRGHYLASFVLSRVVFLGLEAAVLIGFAWIAFGVAVHGSVFTLVIVCALGALAFGAALRCSWPAVPRPSKGSPGCSIS